MKNINKSKIINNTHSDSVIYIKNYIESLKHSVEEKKMLKIIVAELLDAVYFSKDKDKNKYYNTYINRLDRRIKELNCKIINTATKIKKRKNLIKNSQRAFKNYEWVKINTLVNFFDKNDKIKKGIIYGKGNLNDSNGYDLKNSSILIEYKKDSIFNYPKTIKQFVSVDDIIDKENLTDLKPLSQITFYCKKYCIYHSNIHNTNYLAVIGKKNEVYYIIDVKNCIEFSNESTENSIKLIDHKGKKYSYTYNASNGFSKK